MNALILLKLLDFIRLLVVARGGQKTYNNYLHEIQVKASIENLTDLQRRFWLAAGAVSGNPMIWIDKENLKMTIKQITVQFAFLINYFLIKFFLLDKNAFAFNDNKNLQNNWWISKRRERIDRKMQLNITQLDKR